MKNIKLETVLNSLFQKYLFIAFIILKFLKICIQFIINLIEHNGFIMKLK
jgi:hypothetical protein